MKTGNKTLVFRYVLNKLIGFNYNDGTSTKEYLYHRNIQGDILGIYDDEGKQVGGYAYDAYGYHVITLNVEEIATINPFRYRGYFYDEETKLYYLNARYYDPETGRFISPDILSILDESKGQINGLNLYIYCGNNPVMRVDPSGSMFIAFTTLIIAIAMGATLGGVTAVVSGKSARKNGWELFGLFLGGALLGGMIGLALGLGAGLAIGGTIFGLSTAASWAVGIGIAVIGTGLAGGINSIISQQILNDDIDWNRVGLDTLQASINGTINFIVGTVTGGAGLWRYKGGPVIPFYEKTIKVIIQSVLGGGLKFSNNLIFKNIKGELEEWENALKGIREWFLGY